MEDIEIKKLLKEYTKTIEKLREAKIVKTNRIVADYGEYVASKILNLKLAENPSNKNYDATGEDGKKYQIKTRKGTAWNPKPTIFSGKNANSKEIDFFIYVGFDNDWELVDLLLIPTEHIKANSHGMVVLNNKLRQNFSILDSIRIE